MNEEEYKKYSIEEIVREFAIFVRKNEYCRCGHRNIFSMKAGCFLDKDAFANKDRKCPCHNKPSKK